MKITDYIDESRIILGLDVASKEELFGALVDRLIETEALDQKRRSALIKKLLDREALLSTGIGGRVAIPHASGEEIEDIALALAQIPNGLEFNSIDDQPVNLVFMIVGAQNFARAHIKLLALIARTMKNRDLIEKLIASSSPRESFEALLEID